MSKQITRHIYMNQGNVLTGKQLQTYVYTKSHLTIKTLTLIINVVTENCS